MSLSNQLFNFKLRSDFKLTNIAKVKSNFILHKLPPVTDVSIVNFMEKLDKIDNEYNKSSTLLAQNCYNYMLHTSCKPSHILCIWQRCDKESVYYKVHKEEATKGMQFNRDCAHCLRNAV